MSRDAMSRDTVSRDASRPPTALLTFSVGPVHTFIAQARRVADLWTGSEVLSHLVREALRAGCAEGAIPIFPVVDPAKLSEGLPKGLPNRFVCRVARDRADAVARVMDSAVRAEWERLAEDAIGELEPRGLAPSDEVREQTGAVFDIAWSWVPEDEGYAAAAREGARRWNALRRFRPFLQRAETGEKCAVCGERTALPDGNRSRVADAWARAEEEEAEDIDKRFFRFSQSRLCLVCATKRLYTKGGDQPQDVERRAFFSAFDRFQPDDDRTYFALVTLDGDRMGDILNWPEDRVRHGLESFHQALSQALTAFAESLRGKRSWQLKTEALGLEGGADAGEDLRQGKSPQLVYAGGEDVMVVCDPRDAVAVARAIRCRYREELAPVAEHLSDPADLARFTLSGAILFAHTKYPAGLAFREAGGLLKRKAKDEADRDALALRLVKRGGVPVETVFKWGQEAPQEGEDGERDIGKGDQGELLSWVDRLGILVEKVRSGELTSKQTYALRGGEEVLAEVFESRHWQPWVRDRLRRNGATAEGAGDMARLVAPFLAKGEGAALRIVRFLGREMERQKERQLERESVGDREQKEAGA